MNLLENYDSCIAGEALIKVLIELRSLLKTCLLYTSDAADERSSVDLGGRRIIKKKKNMEQDGGVRSTKKKKKK